MTARHRRPALMALVGLGAAALITTTAIGAAQVFRADVDTVFLSVTVTDGRNRPITDLTRDDFRVFEDGRVQDVSVFTKEPQPIALSLLIDSSLSMTDKMATAREAAIGFARRLGPHDVAQLLDFNNGIQIRQTFTNDVSALENAVRQIQIGTSTSLYTAMYVALAELRRARAEHPTELRRQAMIVLSDGEDTSSRTSYDDVAQAAKESTVTIYTVGLRDKGPDPDRRFSQADFALRSLSQFTGGRVFFVDDVKQLPAIYTQIADELANQYFVGYNTKNTATDGAWRQIAVRVARPDTAVRTKTGYYGPKKAP